MQHCHLCLLQLRHVTFFNVFSLPCVKDFGRMGSRQVDMVTALSFFALLRFLGLPFLGESSF